MEIVWLLVTGLLLAGWFGLDGFSLGSGMFLAVLRRDAEARRRVVAAVGPFFLANEVWLIAFAGVLAVAFPEAEARLFTALHPVIVVMIAAWLVRDAGMWFRARRPGRRWQARWEATLAGSSAVFAGAAGFFLGNAVQVTSGGGPAPFNLYALLSGVASMALFSLHGVAFIAARTTGRLRDRATRTAGRLAPPVIVLLAALIGTAPLTVGDVTPTALMLGVIGPIAVAAAWFAIRNGRDGFAFVATALATASLPLTAGALMAARLLDWAADPSALQRLSLVVLPVLPLLLAGQALLWWIHRRRVSERSVTFF